jgi:hypothetical protein
VDVKEDTLGLNRDLIGINDELENVEVKIGVVSPVDILGGIALLSPAVGCCGRDLNVHGQAGKEEVGVFENVVHEGDLNMINI